MTYSSAVAVRSYVYVVEPVKPPTTSVNPSWFATRDTHSEFAVIVTYFNRLPRAMSTQ